MNNTTLEGLKQQLTAVVDSIAARAQQGSAEQAELDALPKLAQVILAICAAESQF